jgi:hypothetical protein
MVDTMPRPRKNDPTSLLNPLIEQFARKLAVTVERFTVSRIERAVKEQARGQTGRRNGARRRPSRSAVLCYYPGCKNVAAPRFGMFCAAEHKNLPKAEKEKYRAAHKEAEAPAAKRGRKKKAASS